MFTHILQYVSHAGGFYPFNTDIRPKNTGCLGETIQISDGAVYIDGKKTDCGFEEEILSAGLASYEITLGEDEYFIMGDNCNNSEDSRVANIGNIKRDQFVGKIVTTIKKEK